MAIKVTRKTSGKGVFFINNFSGIEKNFSGRFGGGRDITEGIGDRFSVFSIYFKGN